ncbi:MAG: DUF3021 family protein, partial [Treponema sp.]|nr:DUF3021 family protein [Treponema sp.]
MKEKINIMIMIFTRVVTAIFLIASIYIALFFGYERALAIKDIWAIMLIGLFSAICYLPFLFEINYSKTAMIILQIVYFVTINVVTLFAGYLCHWFTLKNPINLLSFEAVVICVYALVMILSYKIDSTSAKKMNK